MADRIGKIFKFALVIALIAMIIACVTSIFGKNKEADETARTEYLEVLEKEVNSIYEDYFAKKYGVSKVDYQLTDFDSSGKGGYVAWMTINIKCNPMEDRPASYSSDLSGSIKTSISKEVRLPSGATVSTQYFNYDKNYIDQRTITGTVDGKVVLQLEKDKNLSAAKSSAASATIIPIIFALILTGVFVYAVVKIVKAVKNGAKIEFAHAKTTGQLSSSAKAKLMEEAKQLLSEKDAILSRYRNDKDYKKLELAMNELHGAYHRCLQSIVSAPPIGKKPMDTFVAAGIGSAIAGTGGAIVMGASAYNENKKWEKQAAQFNQHLAKINSAEGQVAYLVREIHLIIDRSPTS